MKPAFLILHCNLELLDSANRAVCSASATFYAILTDFVFAINLGNSTNRAGSSTGAAAYASVFVNFQSHSLHLPSIIYTQW